MGPAPGPSSEFGPTSEPTSARDRELTSKPDLTSGGRPRALAPAPIALATVALAAGVAIGYLDSRPGWDDTGVTAAFLLVTSALSAAIDGRRPWFWALLVGLPLPIIELAASGFPGSPASGGSGAVGSIAALVFALAGAGLGWLARRASGSSEGTT